MKPWVWHGVAFLVVAGVCVTPAAQAQTTGEEGFDQQTEAILIATGTDAEVPFDGLRIDDTPAPRMTFTNERIMDEVPGQSLFAVFDVVPNTHFDNIDNYGAAGGAIRLRGEEGNRIGFTLDGIPMNDAGTYAIYTNQGLDPELIDRAHITPGASAIDMAAPVSSGGTIDYRMVDPDENFSARLRGVYGRFHYYRVFGEVNSGEITKWGTRMLFSASRAENSKFKGPGYLVKRQFNLKIYQPIGSSDDYFTFSGVVNRNRNNSFRKITIDQIKSYYKIGNRDLFDYNYYCARPRPQAGTDQDEQTGITSVSAGNTDRPLGQTVQQMETMPGVVETNCGLYHGVRLNPSTDWNARSALKLTLRPNLIFTMDAAYRYLLRNEGGWSTLYENSAQARGAAVNAPGVDLNADGDTLDRIGLYTPDNQATYRYTLLPSLSWQLASDHALRLAYTLDHARHLETGQAGFLSYYGEPLSVWAGRTGKGPKDASDNDLRTRWRQSIIRTDQIGAEYRGFWLNRKVEARLALKVPRFKRALNQHCYTRLFGTAPEGVLGSANQYCSTQPEATLAVASPDTASAAGGPGASGQVLAPYRRTLKWHRWLPSAGIVVRPHPAWSVNASWNRGMAPPKIETLYQDPFATPKAEYADTADLGVRYLTPRLRITLDGFYTLVHHRMTSVYDAQRGLKIERNAGRIRRRGAELTVGIKPVDGIVFYGWASYLDSEYRNDIEAQPGVVLHTRGRKTVDAPKWQAGLSPTLLYKGSSIGLTAKYVSRRAATETNDLWVKSYWLLDLNAKFSLEDWGLKDAHLLLNVGNLLDRKAPNTIQSTLITPTGARKARFASLAPGAIAYDAADPLFDAMGHRTVSLAIQIGF